MTNTSKIKEMANLASLQNGCYVYDIYKHRDRLQVFIDKDQQGVNLEDCKNVLQSLQFLLHSELPSILGSRRLEVSSPGVEKRLREKWHFEKSVGKMMKVHTASPVKAQNTRTGKSRFSQFFTAILASISENHLHFEKNDVKWVVPLSEVKGGQLVFTSLQNDLKQNKKKKYKK